MRNPGNSVTTIQRSQRIRKNLMPIHVLQIQSRSQNGCFRTGCYPEVRQSPNLCQSLHTAHPVESLRPAGEHLLADTCHHSAERSGRTSCWTSSQRFHLAGAPNLCCCSRCHLSTPGWCCCRRLSCRLHQLPSTPHSLCSHGRNQTPERSQSYPEMILSSHRSLRRKNFPGRNWSLIELNQN